MWRMAGHLHRFLYFLEKGASAENIALTEHLFQLVRLNSTEKSLAPAICAEMAQSINLRSLQKKWVHCRTCILQRTHLLHLNSVLLLRLMSMLVQQ